jgi:hypothetical protein
VASISLAMRKHPGAPDSMRAVAAHRDEKLQR